MVPKQVWYRFPGIDYCTVSIQRGKVPIPSRSLLLLSGLRPLSGAGVVPDLVPEADGHGDVAVVHRHHRHLLPGRPVRDAQAADVGLKNTRGQRSQSEAVLILSTKTKT